MIDKVDTLPSTQKPIATTLKTTISTDHSINNTNLDQVEDISISIIDGYYSQKSYRTRQKQYERLCEQARTFNRAIPSTQVADDQIVKQIRLWLTFCLDHHKMACGNAELVESKFSPDEEILLIDVRRLCLFRGLTSYRYLALSYVWGETKGFHTTKQTIESLLKPNALVKCWHDIPTVIRDAIDLADQLEEQYLWVDALCIVQDDADSKHQQLLLMAEIYNSATATLVSCSGSDANNKLVDSVAIRGKFRAQETATYGNDTLVDYNTPKALRPFNQKKFIGKVEETVWSTRGWTYQERRLSRRRIYILKNEIMFHCRADLFSPFGDTEVPISSLSSLQYRRSHDNLAEIPDDLGPANWHLGFNFWAEIVQEYTQKHLKHQSDILNACMGILCAFEGYTTWPNIYGMPQPLIDIVLHWAPKTIVTRTPCSKNSKENFPSWSWLAWKGPVHFDLIKEGKYICNMVSTIKSVGFEQPDGSRAAPISVKAVNGSSFSFGSVQAALGHSQSLLFKADMLSASELIQTVNFKDRTVALKSCMQTESHMWLFNQSGNRCGLLYGVDVEQAIDLHRKAKNGLYFIALSIRENTWVSRTIESASVTVGNGPGTVRNVMLIEQKGRCEAGPWYERVAVGYLWEESRTPWFQGDIVLR
jgi:heterokaryon incompatibility protein (HET)